VKKSYAGRHNTRFSVRWPVIYGTNDCVAEGTLVDLSAVGGRMAGTMPVELGGLLWLRVYPPHSHGEIRVEQARVTWVKNQEFGIQLQHLSPADHHWLLRYTEHAERRSTFKPMPVPMASDSAVSLMPLSLPVQD